VARGEVLLAKQVCDCFLTGHVVQLARWRAQGVDTWHGLRFFERWAGEEVVDALGRTFAMYDADDIRRALRVTGELFGRLEDDVARRFALASPVDRAEILARFEATGQLVARAASTADSENSPDDGQDQNVRLTKR
jgi:hypothetical protein